MNSRCDQSANANWLLIRADAVVGIRCLDRVAVDTRGLLAKPLEKVDGELGLARCFRGRLAVFPGDERRQVSEVLCGQIVPFAQQLGAFTAGERSKTGEGFLRRLNGCDGIGLIELGTGGNGLSSRRVYVLSDRGTRLREEMLGKK